MSKKKSKDTFNKHTEYIYFNGKAFMLKESIQMVLLLLLVCTFTTVLQIFFSAPLCSTSIAMVTCPSYIIPLCSPVKVPDGA